MIIFRISAVYPLRLDCSSMTRKQEPGPRRRTSHLPTMLTQPERSYRVAAQGLARLPFLYRWSGQDEDRPIRKTLMPGHRSYLFANFNFLRALAPNAVPGSISRFSYDLDGPISRFRAGAIDRPSCVSPLFASRGQTKMKGVWARFDALPPGP